MVRWFLVRHARAVPFGGGLPDSERALTPEGAERFRKQVRRMEKIGFRFDRIYHSPLERAVQTAELLVPLLDGELVATEHLAAPPSEALLSEVRGESVALVGHNPSMPELLAWLLTGNRDHAGAFRFKKGAVAWVEGEPVPGGMELRGFLSAKVLK